MSSSIAGRCMWLGSCRFTARANPSGDAVLVRLERNSLGPRLHVGRWRIHHAHTGATLIALGAWLIFGDRRDFPWR
jgi:hypothetical protein